MAYLSHDQLYYLCFNNITFTLHALVSFFADAFEAIHSLNAGGMMGTRVGFAEIAV